MKTIALTSTKVTLVDPVHSAYPDARLVLHGLPDIETLANHQRLMGLVIGEAALERGTGIQLAMLKSRFPELAIVAVVPLSSSLHESLHELATGQVDVIVSGFEDDPSRVREVFERAGVSAVAHVVAHACERSAPTFVWQNVAPAAMQVAELRSPIELARALGREVRQLGSELRLGGLPLPRTLLSWLRVLRASRCLQEEQRPLTWLASQVGYRTVRSLENAFQHYLKNPPSIVREQGGLWFASRLFRQAVGDSLGKAAI